MAATTHDLEVAHIIAASPEAVYALVTDLPRMGEWSPENTGGRWVTPATGASVGAKFRGTNKSGKAQWTTIAKVVVADPGREFAFDVTATGMGVARWGYRLESVDGGTRVTEYWDDHRSAVMKKVTGFVLRKPDRRSYNEMSMRRTLEGMAASLTR
jgi:uncharacterized protein YndB with AHSA1/START domain